MTLFQFQPGFLIFAFFAVTLVNASSAAASDQPTDDEIVVQPGVDVAATVEGQPLSLRILSGGPDRLVLDARSAARLRLKPALFVGRASLNVAGRREFVGRNRPVELMIGGASHKTRALWFPQAPAMPADGTIGPWGLPQKRVTLTFGEADTAAIRTEFPLLGGVDSSSVTGYREATFGMYLGFDLDDRSQLPRASAAAGAAIARVYGGTLSGATWDVEIAFGIKRPVRLLTLERPFKIGPLSFTKIAVRVRDRIDAAGRGDNIREAETVEDPSEVVVTAKVKGRPPIFSFVVPRTAMAGCSRLSFDKQAKRIELWCKPGS